MHKAHLALSLALLLLVPLHEVAAAKAVRTEFDRVRTSADWQISTAAQLQAVL